MGFSSQKGSNFYLSLVLSWKCETHHLHLQLFGKKPEIFSRSLTPILLLSLSLCHIGSRLLRKSLPCSCNDWNSEDHKDFSLLSFQQQCPFQRMFHRVSLAFQLCWASSDPRGSPLHEASLNSPFFSQTYWIHLLLYSALRFLRTSDQINSLL